MARILIFGHKPKDYISWKSREKVDVIISKSFMDAKKRISFESFIMVIIDLEDNEINGIGLADFIRKSPLQRSTPIVFISKNRRKEHVAFHEFHCYDYFIKPLSSQDVLKILCLCYFRIDEERWGSTIVFRIGSERFPVRIDDILYIEKIARTTIVHTTTGEFRVPSLSLASFLEEHGADFVRIHRGTIVNKSHVRHIIPSKLMLLLDNTEHELDIGRSFLNDLRDSFD